MDYIGESLLKETIKFLKLCQKQTINGKISLEDYYLMTHIKFNFIDNMLNQEKVIVIDKDLRLELKELYMNDYYIYSISKNAAGN